MDPENLDDDLDRIDAAIDAITPAELQIRHDTVVMLAHLDDLLRAHAPDVD